MTIFDKSVIQAIQRHAVEAYPNESCGLVIGGQYHPKENIHPEPREAFAIADREFPRDGSLQAVVHSHPEGKLEPSIADMEYQLAGSVPWGVLTVKETSDYELLPSDVLWWGDQLDPPPLLGRQFRSGPSGSDGKGDCYALIRDFYRLELGIRIAEFPRDDAWYSNPKMLGDMYRENFNKAGFKAISRHDVRHGDVLLMNVMSKNNSPNHGGIYIDQPPHRGAVLHHLINRLSVRDSAHRFNNCITHFLRYEG